MDNNAELQNRQFHVKYDNRELTIDELKPLFTEAGYICAGHGTGRSGNGDEVVNSIFEKGLRTKDNSFCFTSILLSTPTPELIEKNKELGIAPPTISSLKNDLNNWQHKESKKIIVARLPLEYINWHGDRDDHDGEMYGAFMNDVKQENGTVNYYLDSRYILGCYNAFTQTFRINKNYEKVLTERTKKKLQIGFLKAVKKTETRRARELEMFPIRNNQTPLASDNSESYVDNFDIADYDDANIEWDFSEKNGLGLKSGDKILITAGFVGSDENSRKYVDSNLMKIDTI